MSTFARVAFQACAFNHSVISPFSINRLQSQLSKRNCKLCKCATITYGHHCYAFQYKPRAWFPYE